MSEYRKLGSTMASINVINNSDATKSSQQEGSSQFGKSQTDSNKSTTDLNSKSDKGLGDFNSGDKDITTKSQSYMSDLKNNKFDINNDTTTQSKGETYSFDAAKDASSVQMKKEEVPEKEDEGGIFSKMMEAMKQEAKDWMMGKLTDGINKITNQDESGSGEQQNSTKKNQQLGVGKISVLGDRSQAMPQDVPQPNIPTTNIPTARAPRMNLPKISAPRMPKF